MNYIKDIPYKVSESVIDGIENKGTLYNAVVEISNDENIKYEIHSSGEYLTAVRALNPIFRYPFTPCTPFGNGSSRFRIRAYCRQRRSR